MNVWEAWKQWCTSNSATTILVGLLLSAVGAVQTVSEGKKVAVKQWRRLALAWRNRVVLKDFYYAEREIGYRICEDGRFVLIREEEVIPCRAMDSIPFVYGWTGDGSTTDKLLFPSGARLENVVPATGADAELTCHRKIVTGASFEKGVPFRFKVQVEATPIAKAPRRILSCKIEHRTDRLTFRVVFPPSGVPAKVAYRVTDRIGGDLEPPEELRIDSLTGETRVSCPSPRPYGRHMIEWS